MGLPQNVGLHGGGPVPRPAVELGVDVAHQELSHPPLSQGLLFQNWPAL